jgi:hypothetical protein
MFTSYPIQPSFVFWFHTHTGMTQFHQIRYQLLPIQQRELSQSHS